METKLLSETKAAEFLSLSPKTLSRWRWLGKGPRFRKLGGAIRYHLDDLIGLILFERLGQGLIAAMLSIDFKRVYTRDIDIFCYNEFWHTYIPLRLLLHPSWC